MNDELSLLERIQQHDQEALTEVYDLYFDQIYRYIYFRLHETDAAADLTSEVFLALVVALKADKPPRTSLVGWLYTVARNLAADYIKHKSRTVPLVDELIADDPPLSDQAHWTQLIPIMKQSLRKLTEEQQDVIALRFGQGLSLAETANLLKKSIGAIKASQHRALASLARLMPEVDNE